MQHQEIKRGAQLHDHLFDEGHTDMHVRTRNIDAVLVPTRRQGLRNRVRVFLSDHVDEGVIEHLAIAIWD